MKLCGYPLCGNPIVTERRGKLRVSRVTMTISAPDEIFQFCSLPCRKVLLPSCLFELALPRQCGRCPQTSNPRVCLCLCTLSVCSVCSVCSACSARSVCQASRYLQGQISRELVYMRTRNPKLYDVQLLGGPKVDRKQRPPPAAGAPDGRNTLGAAAMPFRHQIVSHGPSAPLSAQPLGAGAGAAAGAGAGAAAAARRDSGRGGSPRPSDSAAGTLEVEPPVMADAVVERHVMAAPTAPSLVPGTQLSIPIQITDEDRDRAAAHDDGGDHDVDVDDVDTGGGA